MNTMTAGVTPSGEGIEGITWNILGQTYVPKQVCETSFSWHATFPPGTFVPPHIHPDQDEFIYVLGGHFDLFLDGKDATADGGDLIRLPQGIAHGIFNNSDAPVTCIFWVSPTRQLWNLFHKIHNVPDPAEVIRLAGEHNIHFLPPPEEG
jgi:uncharacterized RmlC-like cupin family protein